jgi:hypothetical protein
MLSHDPRPRWARMQPLARLIVALCAALLAFGATAAAGSSQPVASSAAMRTAVIARVAVDKTLASSSKALRACLREHPKGCRADRQAVKHARAQLTSLDGRIAKASHHRRGSKRKDTPPSAPTPTAPVVPVTPPTESTPAPKSGSPAGTESGSGSGSASGSTSSSGGSTEGSGSSTGTGSGGSTGSTGSGTEGITSPNESSTSTSSSFQPGLNSGWEPTWDVEGAAKLGAKLIRLDVGIEQSPQSMEPIVADYAAKGTQVEFLADFYGSMPTPAEADNLATWAKTFGPGGTFWAQRTDGQLAAKMIEFGNETSYSYQYTNDTTAGYASRAQTYALRFKEAAIAIRTANPGVGLLAQGDAGNAGTTWIENMFKAVPNLGQYVTGWTIHPYGPRWRPRLEALIHETAAQGAPSSIPIDITEWGLATDNGYCLTENYGWNPCMTYGEAGEVLTRTVSEMRQTLGGRMGLFMLYQIRDQQATGATNDREAYFGALQHELQSKGAYTTAAEALFTS